MKNVMSFGGLKTLTLHGGGGKENGGCPAARLCMASAWEMFERWEL